MGRLPLPLTLLQHFRFCPWSPVMQRRFFLSRRGSRSRHLQLPDPSPDMCDHPQSHAAATCGVRLVKPFPACPVLCYCKSLVRPGHYEINEIYVGTRAGSVGPRDNLLFSSPFRSRRYANQIVGPTVPSRSFSSCMARVGGKWRLPSYSAIVPDLALDI